MYKSLASEEFLPNQDLFEMGESCSRNNQDKDITGILVYTGKQFLQVLEGPSADVNSLFQKISRDERHHSVELVTFEQDVEPYFDDWSMRLVDLYDLPGEIRQFFTRKYEHEEEMVIVPKRLLDVNALLLDVRAICKNHDLLPFVKKTAVAG